LNFDIGRGIHIIQTRYGKAVFQVGTLYIRDDPRRTGKRVR
jgi:hypothetical protein